MSDDQLADWVSSNAQLGSNASNLAIAEITRRSIIKNSEATMQLKTGIDRFSSSSEKYSIKMMWLTWVLVALTIVLAILAIITIIDAKKQAELQNNINLNSMFFNGANTKIIDVIENSQPILKESKGSSSDAQLDNYLGMFDTIESSYERDSLSESDLCDSFSYYINMTSKNVEIEKYIINSQKEDSGFFVSLADLEKIVQNSKNKNCKK